LETVASYFTVANTQAKLQKYLEQARQLHASLDDFWFVYDNPTDFDQHVSDGLKRELALKGCPNIPAGIIYYRNPLTRLVSLRRNTRTPYKT